jgi:hypothetical protein
VLVSILLMRAPGGCSVAAALLSLGLSLDCVLDFVRCHRSLMFIAIDESGRAMSHVRYACVSP